MWVGSQSRATSRKRTTTLAGFIARDGEPEDQARYERRRGPQDVRRHQKTCLVTKTVSIATPKNVAIATTERRERRATPQRPWPLVQPEPRRVPKPTRRPPARIVGSGARTLTGTS